MAPFISCLLNCLIKKLTYVLPRLARVAKGVNLVATFSTWRLPFAYHVIMPFEQSRVIVGGSNMKGCGFLGLIHFWKEKAFRHGTPH